MILYYHPQKNILRVFFLQSMKLKRDLREYSLPVNIDDKSGLSSGEENNQDRRRTNLKGKAIFTLVSIRDKAPPFNIPVVDCTPPKKSEWNPPHIETGVFRFSLYIKLIYRIVLNNRSRFYPLCSILGWGNSVKCLKQMIKVTEITKSAFQRNIQNTSSAVKQ